MTVRIDAVLMLFLLCFPTCTQVWPLTDLTFFSFVTFLSILEPSFKKLQRVTNIITLSLRLSDTASLPCKLYLCSHYQQVSHFEKGY